MHTITGFLGLPPGIIPFLAYAYFLVRMHSKKLCT